MFEEWEYKNEINLTQKQLDKEGELGWEVYYTTLSNDGSEIVYFMKRKKRQQVKEVLHG